MLVLCLSARRAALILVFAIATNVTVNLRFNELANHFPFIGVAVWVAILISVPLRRPDWEILPETFKGSLFLLSLVSCASMMPVEKLPPASALSALSLGFISAVFDNIPLTALALKQGGYDWGFLAYAVGFGGSMIWFGSSSGVALSNMYPEAKSVGNWLRHGWHVALAYVVGFAMAGLGVLFAVALIVLRLAFGAGWAGDGMFVLFAVLFVFTGGQFIGMGLLEAMGALDGSRSLREVAVAAALYVIIASLAAWGDDDWAKARESIASRNAADRQQRTA